MMIFLQQVRIGKLKSATKPYDSYQYAVAVATNSQAASSSVPVNQPTRSCLVVLTILDDAEAAVTNEYKVAKKALDDHFSPAKNAEFEIHNFCLAKQQVGETIDDYHSRLRSLAKYCLFADVDAEIKSHIIQTCLST